MRRLLRVATTLVLAFVLIQALYAWFLIDSVDSMTSAVKQLRTGFSSQADVEAFARQFHLFAYSDNGCHGDYCEYDFVVTNWPMSLPKISPPAMFTVFLHTRNGVLDQADVGIFRAESRWTVGDRVVRVFEGPYAVSGQPIYRVTGPHYDPVLAIWLQKGAPPAERNRAYAFSTKCIALPFGCGRPCDFHSEAWKDAEEFIVPPNPPVRDRRGTFRVAACR